MMRRGDGGRRGTRPRYVQHGPRSQPLRACLTDP
jgi:hypothetical protein